MIDFSTIFKDIRRHNKYSQLEFANKIALSRSAIAQVETNKNKPSRSVILTILETIDLPENIKIELKKYVSLKEWVNVGVTNKTDNFRFNADELVGDRKEAYDLLVKLWTYQPILLALSLSLKNFISYEFNEEEVLLFEKIENRIKILTPIVILNRDLDPETFYRIEITLRDLKTQIKEYSNLINSKFNENTRQLTDINNPKNYNEISDDFPF